MSPWIVTLLTNVWVPIALLLIALVGRRYENADWPGAYIMHIVMLVGINIILAVSLQLINGVSGQFSLGHAGFMALGAYLAGYAIKTFAAVSADADDPASDYFNPAATLLFFIALLIAVALAAAVIFGIFLLIRQSRRLHPSLPGVLLVALLAWFLADIAKGMEPGDAPKYCIFTRLIGGDHALFDSIIAHGTSRAGKWSDALPVGARKPTTLLISLIGGGAMAAVAGLIVGLPTLRLRGDYLAIATLGFGEIIRIAIVNSPPLGGATGLQAPTYAIKPDIEEGIRGYYIAPWIYGAVLLTILLIWRLARSTRGRAIRAVREDEIAAAATGISTTHQKVTAFVFGAFFAGVAGALYVNLDGYLNTASFGFMRSIEIVVMVTLGGLGSIWGAAIAAVILTILPEVLRNVSPQVSEWRMVIYSLLLIGLMLMRSGWWRRAPLIRAIPFIG
ncbi:MAG TPA: branched-chain amino acid ABC transporter permease, partial [Tepidisphaeraceae bacterium]|nr:branched-chain amino acid ABC transporter permease [Tepidisphaeraceae bacterium]